MFYGKKFVLISSPSKSPAGHKRNGLIPLTQGHKLLYFMHKNYQHVESRSIFTIDSGPIINMPDPPIGSLAPVLHYLHANLHKQIVLSDDAYRFIADTYDKVHVKIAGFVLIRA